MTMGNILSISLIKSVTIIVMVLLGSCKKMPDSDCSGKSSYPVTTFIDNTTAQNIANSICSALNNEDVPGIQVSIIDSLGHAWTLSLGTTDKKRKNNLEDNNKFRLASMTKPFIATLIFKLIEEGQLNLENKVSDYFPDYTNASKITIANLLNHSSGLKDLLTLPDILLTSTSNTTKVWNPNEIAETILKKDLKFTPGTENQYSNSNYLLLGLIAKIITGKELDVLLAEKLFNPNGISGITFNPIQVAPSDLISGYDRKFIPYLGLYELTSKNTSFSSAAYASGNLVANSSDAAIFFHKLFMGEIINQNSLNKMLQFTQVVNSENEYQTYFGNGMFKYQLQNETYYGHEGQFIGFDNVVVFNPQRKFTVVLLGNLSTYNKFQLLIEILGHL